VHTESGPGDPIRLVDPGEYGPIRAEFGRVKSHAVSHR
jgi:hypothetical protein